MTHDSPVFASSPTQVRPYVCLKPDHKFSPRVNLVFDCATSDGASSSSSDKCSSSSSSSTSSHSDSRSGHQAIGGK